jgi:hypothetical protein
MNAATLTNTFVADVTFDGTRRLYHDAHGLALEVGPRKRWVFLHTDPDGHPLRVVLGSTSAYSLAQARTWAQYMEGRAQASIARECATKRAARSERATRGHASRGQAKGVRS